MLFQLIPHFNHDKPVLGPPNSWKLDALEHPEAFQLEIIQLCEQHILQLQDFDILVVMGDFEDIFGVGHCIFQEIIAVTVATQRRHCRRCERIVLCC